MSDRETKDDLPEFHAEVSPDGPDAFDVLDAKLEFVTTLGR